MREWERIMGKYKIQKSIVIQQLGLGRELRVRVPLPFTWHFRSPGPRVSVWRSELSLGLGRFQFQRFWLTCLELRWEVKSRVETWGLSLKGLRRVLWLWLTGDNMPQAEEECFWFEIWPVVALVVISLLTWHLRPETWRWRPTSRIQERDDQ
jgi:hypothetical protein